MASELAAAGSAVRPVRVSRNGNARTLTIPAEIAEAAHIEPGDQFAVQAVGDTLIYRRLAKDRPGRFVGEGNNRFLVLPRGQGMPAGPDLAPTPPLDWDY